MDKKIFVGDIEEETYYGTPIELFKKAIEISKEECFIIETNNPQFVEALEVLCGEENIEFYICTDGHSCKVDRATEVYNYLDDVYNIINSLRFAIQLKDDFDEDYDFTDEILKEIEEYEIKYQYLSEEDFAVDERKSCKNCDYHDYDWFDEGDEFEVCLKGNNMDNNICEDWREL